MNELRTHDAATHISAKQTGANETMVSASKGGRQGRRSARHTTTRRRQRNQTHPHKPKKQKRRKSETPIARRAASSQPQRGLIAASSQPHPATCESFPFDSSCALTCPLPPEAAFCSAHLLILSLLRQLSVLPYLLLLSPATVQPQRSPAAASSQPRRSLAPCRKSKPCPDPHRHGNERCARQHGTEAHCQGIGPSAAKTELPLASQGPTCDTLNPPQHKPSRLPPRTNQAA